MVSVNSPGFAVAPVEIAGAKRPMLDAAAARWLDEATAPLAAGV